MMKPEHFIVLLFCLVMCPLCALPVLIDNVSFNAFMSSLGGIGNGMIVCAIIGGIVVLILGILIKTR